MGVETVIEIAFQRQADGAGANLDQIAQAGHRGASICHLGTIALRTGLKLQWDADAETFVGEHAKEANAFLARAMRKPYDYDFS